MAKQENNRMRVSLPVSGLDTSTPDQTVADGKCEELHNLRWESGSWHNIDPLKIKSRLSPTAGQEALFEKLTIIYHHPAAGDDAYIASIPNADGTIDLHQVNLPNDHPEDGLAICNIYFVQENAADGIPILGLVSSKPVASDCGVEFTCKSSSSSKIEESDHFILTGETKSIDKIQDAILVDITRTWPEKDDTYRYRFYKSQDEILSNKRFAQNLPADIRITHFGNILIVMDNTNRRVIHYYLSNGDYEEFQIPDPPIVRQSMKLASGNKKGYTGIYPIESDKESLPSSTLQKLFDREAGIFCLGQFITDKPEYFWGEICYFAVFQMIDGSNISPSALQICAAEPPYCSVAGRTYLGGNSLDTEVAMNLAKLWRRENTTGNETQKYILISAPGSSFVSVFNMAIRPYLTINIPHNINPNMINAVKIYTTRINPIWDAEKLKSMPFGYSTDFKKYRADNNLPEQPFYLAKTISLEDFTNDTYSFYLDGTYLKDVEMNVQYEPTEIHRLYYNLTKEYNSRLHVGGELNIRLFEGYGQDFFSEGADSSDYAILTNVRIDETDYRVKAPVPHPLNSFTTFISTKILSYPDYRATYMYAPELPNGTVSYKIPMHAARANNFAYAIYGDDSETGTDNIEYNYVKYSAAIFKGMQPEKRKIDITDKFVTQKNKLRVSAPNNPFSFPLANSYAIGTENNRIHAINSAAIEMSDAKFGEFPLFVFTEEGIFTLQSGSGEVLYSATIPLNYDRIVNPATLAVNHNILYVTARGIQAMFSNESRLISEPINNLHNTPPLDYLRTAKMCYQPAHNEVIVWNPAHAIGRAVAGTRAYVFSLDGGYWSTRDLEGVKLNTDELVVHTSNQFLVLDLSEEEARSGQPVRIRLVTRPLKFGSTEFKRLETFVARLHTQSPQSLRLLFAGSSDLKTWITLRDTGFFRTDRDTLLRRFPGSIRFLRVTLEADLDAGFELAQFDAEYYTRFLHRLR